MNITDEQSESLLAASFAQSAAEILFPDEDFRSLLVEKLTKVFLQEENNLHFLYHDFTESGREKVVKLLMFLLGNQLIRDSQL